MQQFTNEANIRQFLAENRWPNGLQNALIQSIQRFPVRFMILDDSGSMIEPDGHILVPHVGQFRYVECSRWKELSTAMKFHAQVAHLANARSEFRFLNGASPIVIGEADSFEKIQLLNNLLDQSPGGGTPLCKHIREVIQQIKSIEGALRSNGQKAVVIIATDGESSDGDIADAMKPLQNLPVWVVIRLCTDSDKIVDYWNNIDSQLELEMDVLDDLNGEAEEVTGNNPWLTYGEPLHRLREWGVHYKEIDLLDESKLSRDQMGSIVNLLLNIDPNRSELPNPSIDWKSYLRVISEANNSELQVWDPINKRMSHWIKINQLNRRYSTSTLCSTPSCVIS